MSSVFPWLRPTAVLVLCALPAAAQNGDMAEKLYYSGERAYAAKSYGEALETWKQLLQSAPRSEFAPQALLRIARHLAEVEGKPAAAMPYLDQLRTDYIKFPAAADGLLLRGTLLAREAHRPSDLKEAMAEFNRVLDLFPDHPAVAGAREGLGQAWRDQGQWARALQQFIEAYRLNPEGSLAPRALLEAAETLDLMGDLDGCLRLLQRVRTEFPRSPLAEEAAWRMAVRVKQRITRPPFRVEGAWPGGKQKWLKTPILLATGGNGDLFIYQNSLDQVFRLQGADLHQEGPTASNARALVITPSGKPWVLTKNSLFGKGDAPVALGSLKAVCGARLDRWGTLWVADSKAEALTLFPAEGEPHSVPSPDASALAELPTGGVVVASDEDRGLHFLDAAGQPKLTVPYGKGLPAPYKYVVALASDPLGHVAALVDGGDFGEGVVLYGPDGSVLRQATFKSLKFSGHITSLALDRTGGIILCDRRNDSLFRLD